MKKMPRGKKHFSTQLCHVRIAKDRDFLPI